MTLGVFEADDLPAGMLVGCDALGLGRADGLDFDVQAASAPLPNEANVVDGFGQFFIHVIPPQVVGAGTPTRVQ